MACPAVTTCLPGVHALENFDDRVPHHPFAHRTAADFFPLQDKNEVLIDLGDNALDGNESRLGVGAEENLRPPEHAGFQQKPRVGNRDLDLGRAGLELQGGVDDLDLPVKGAVGKSRDGYFHRLAFLEGEEFLFNDIDDHLHFAQIHEGQNGGRVLHHRPWIHIAFRDASVHGRKNNQIRSWAWTKSSAALAWRTWASARARSFSQVFWRRLFRARL